MLWIYLNNQGDVGCSVNVGNRIRQGNAFDAFVVLDGMQTDPASNVWELVDIGVMKIGGTDFHYVMGNQAGEGDLPISEELFQLGDPSQANAYFQGNTSYKGYKVRIPAEMTASNSNGGHIGLSFLMRNGDGGQLAATWDVFVDATYGKQKQPMTADDFATLLKFFRSSNVFNLGEQENEAFLNDYFGETTSVYYSIGNQAKLMFMAYDESTQTTWQYQLFFENGRNLLFRYRTYSPSEDPDTHETVWSWSEWTVWNELSVNEISSVIATPITGGVRVVITQSDGTETPFTLMNGADGNGISGIAKISSSGLQDTYRISYTNGGHFDFIVTNGASAGFAAPQSSATASLLPAGSDPTASASVSASGPNTEKQFNFNFAFGIPKGDKGDQGVQGIQGPTGNGIASVAKISTVGLVDTYRITYTDGNHFDFEVNNGANGADGNGSKLAGPFTASSQTFLDFVNSVGYKNIVSLQDATGAQQQFAFSVSGSQATGITLYAGNGTATVNPSVDLYVNYASDAEIVSFIDAGTANSQNGALDLIRQTLNTRSKPTTVRSKYHTAMGDTEYTAIGDSSCASRFFMHLSAPVGGTEEYYLATYSNGSWTLNAIPASGYGFIELTGSSGTLTYGQSQILNNALCVIKHDDTLLFLTERNTTEEYVAFKSIPNFDSSELIYADQRQETILVFPEDGYEWEWSNSNIYDNLLFRAKTVEPESALTTIEAFLAECDSYNGDFSENDGHRYRYSRTSSAVPHVTTDYWAEFLNDSLAALVRVREHRGGTLLSDKLYFCNYDSGSWSVNELASTAYVDAHDIGFIEIDDSNDDHNGSLTAEQKAQAQKPFCVIKYVDSNDLAMYFTPIFDYTFSQSSRTFHCVEGWVSSSTSGVAREQRAYDIALDDLDTDYPSWEWNESVYGADEAPTSGSSNLVTSGGVYSAIQNATTPYNLPVMLTVNARTSITETQGEAILNAKSVQFIVGTTGGSRNFVCAGYYDYPYQRIFKTAPLNGYSYEIKLYSSGGYQQRTYYIETVQCKENEYLNCGTLTQQADGSYSADISSLIPNGIWWGYSTISVTLGSGGSSYELKLIWQDYNNRDFSAATSDGSITARISNASSTFTIVAHANHDVSQADYNAQIDELDEQITSLTRTLIHKDDYSTLSTSFSAYGVAPKALPKASIDGFLGNSVVRNQLVNTNGASTQTINEVTFTKNDDGSFTVNGTADGNAFYQCGYDVPTKSGSKYIVCGGVPSVIFLDDSSVRQFFATEPTIFTSSGADLKPRFRVANGNTVNNVRVKPIISCITQAFGSNDLIPADLLSTPSLIYSKYSYLLTSSYDAGALLDSDLTKLTSQPFNVWDEEWEQGLFNSLTGENIAATNQIRSKNLFKVIGGQTYLGYGATCWVMFYDENNDVITLPDSAYTSNNVMNLSSPHAIPTNACFAKFYCTTTYGGTYKNDICINISNADLNGTYLPHDASIETPLSIGTMRSAGSVRDSNELTKVGTYTFTGSENWVYSSTYNFWYVENLIPSNAVSVNNGKTLVGNGIKVAIIGDGRTIRVYESDNPQISSSSVMGTVFPSGTKMNYQLATPTARSTTFPELLDIHSGGAIEASYTNVPVETKITYLEEE